MENKNRDWTVLFVGGPSGTGKSSFAHLLAQHYGVNIVEVDDIELALKAVTTRETLPQIHYWSTGPDWKKIGVAANVDWLIHVSGEIAPAIKAVVENHLEEDTPVIIEGDFLLPAFAASFQSPKVRALFLYEEDKEQIVQNYLAREGGERQDFRASIGVAYGRLLAEACRELDIPVLEARPWDTAVERAMEYLASC